MASKCQSHQDANIMPESHSRVNAQIYVYISGVYVHYFSIILFNHCSHSRNHETILFIKYFSAKYAYLAMRIKKDDKH